jgi:hypothetical protein
LIRKPVLFSALELTPRFTKTMNGKEYVYEGPGVGGAPKVIKI